MSPRVTGVLSMLVPIVGWLVLGYTAWEVWEDSPRGAVLLVLAGSILYVAGYLHGGFLGRQEERIDQTLRTLRARADALGVTNN